MCMGMDLTHERAMAARSTLAPGQPRPVRFRRECVHQHRHRCGCQRAYNEIGVQRATRPLSTKLDITLGSRRLAGGGARAGQWGAEQWGGRWPQLIRRGGVRSQESPSYRRIS
jgi:hypothetical protein